MKAFLNVHISGKPSFFVKRSKIFSDPNFEIESVGGSGVLTYGYDFGVGLEFFPRWKRLKAEVEAGIEAEISAGLNLFFQSGEPYLGYEFSFEPGFAFVRGELKMLEVADNPDSGVVLFNIDYKFDIVLPKITHEGSTSINSFID